MCLERGSYVAASGDSGDAFSDAADLAEKGLGTRRIDFHFWYLLAHVLRYVLYRFLSQAEEELWRLCKAKTDGRSLSDFGAGRLILACHHYVVWGHLCFGGVSAKQPQLLDRLASERALRNASIYEEAEIGWQINCLGADSQPRDACHGIGVPAGPQTGQELCPPNRQTFSTDRTKVITHRGPFPARLPLSQFRPGVVPQLEAARARHQVRLGS